jgi:hypothetical protein
MLRPKNINPTIGHVLTRYSELSMIISYLNCTIVQCLCFARAIISGLFFKIVQPALLLGRTTKYRCPAQHEVLFRQRTY